MSNTWRLSFGSFFFFQAEDGIRDLVRSRGLGDVYKRQVPHLAGRPPTLRVGGRSQGSRRDRRLASGPPVDCLLYTSDAADERSSVDLGGRRIIKKKKKKVGRAQITRQQQQQDITQRSRK